MIRRLIILLLIVGCDNSTGYEYKCFWCSKSIYVKDSFGYKINEVSKIVDVKDYPAYKEPDYLQKYSDGRGAGFSSGHLLQMAEVRKSNFERYLLRKESWLKDQSAIKISALEIFKLSDKLNSLPNNNQEEVLIELKKQINNGFKKIYCTGKCASDAGNLKLENIKSIQNN